MVLRSNRLCEVHGILLLPRACGLRPCMYLVAAVSSLLPFQPCVRNELRLLGPQSLRRSLLALGLSSCHRRESLLLNLVEPCEPLNLAALRFGRHRASVVAYPSLPANMQIIGPGLATTAPMTGPMVNVRA